MRFMPGLLALSAAAAMAMLPGCATPRSNPDVLAEYAAWVDGAVAALQQQGDPGSLVAVALLRESPLLPVDRADSVALEALRAAAASAPEHRAVAALLLQACLAARECAPTEPAAHLRRIDPGNGIADLARLRVAVQSGDGAVIDSALTALSAATTFNSYFNANMVAASDALERTRLPAAPDQRRSGAAEDWLYSVIGKSSPYTTVGVQELARACREADATDARRPSCLRTLGTLMLSDTLVIQSFAVRETLRLAPPESPEAANAAVLRRRLDWYDERLSAGLKPWTYREVPARLLAALRNHPREEDARRALLIEMKFAPDPPAGWAPK